MILYNFTKEMPLKSRENRKNEKESRCKIRYRTQDTRKNKKKTMLLNFVGFCFASEKPLKKREEDKNKNKLRPRLPR